MRECDHCGDPFEPTRPDQRFCAQPGKRCRTLYWQERYKKVAKPGESERAGQPSRQHRKDLNLGPELCRDLEQAALEADTTQTDVVRQALRAFLYNHHKE